METQKGRCGEPEEARILVLTHCILNLATRWRLTETTAGPQGPVSQVLEFLVEKGIGSVQLPCPESTFCGNPRPPRTRDELENLPSFRHHCKGLAKTAAQQLDALIRMSQCPRIRIVAVVGIERSPSCAVSCTPRSGIGGTRFVEGKGLFMEALGKELSGFGLRVPFVGFDLREPEASVERLIRRGEEHEEI